MRACIESTSFQSPATLRPRPGPGLEGERSALIWKQDIASARRLQADPHVFMQAPWNSLALCAPLFGDGVG